VKNEGLQKVSYPDFLDSPSLIVLGVKNMNQYEETVRNLVNNFNEHNIDIVAQDLAKMGRDIITILQKYFYKVDPNGKIGILETLKLLNDSSVIPFLKAILENETEIFFVKAYAESVLDFLEGKETQLKRKIHNLYKKSGTDLIADIAMIGTIGDYNAIRELDKIKTNNKEVLEQIKVAKLQIICGLEEIIKEYRKPDSSYSHKALAEAIYHSFDHPEASKVIIEDLFSEEFERVFSAVTLLAFTEKFPKDKVTRDVVNKFFEILTGDFNTTLKNHAILAIGRYGNTDDASRLERIVEEKKYLTKRKFWKWLSESALLDDINITIKKLNERNRRFTL